MKIKAFVLYLLVVVVLFYTIGILFSKNIIEGHGGGGGGHGGH